MKYMEKGLFASLALMFLSVFFSSNAYAGWLDDSIGSLKSSISSSKDVCATQRSDVENLGVDFEGNVLTGAAMGAVTGAAVGYMNGDVQGALAGAAIGGVAGGIGGYAASLYEQAKSKKELVALVGDKFNKNTDAMTKLKPLIDKLTNCRVNEYKTLAKKYKSGALNMKKAEKAKAAIDMRFAEDNKIVNEVYGVAEDNRKSLMLVAANASNMTKADFRDKSVSKPSSKPQGESVSGLAESAKGFFSNLSSKKKEKTSEKVKMVVIAKKGENIRPNANTKKPPLTKVQRGSFLYAKQATLGKKWIAVTTSDGQEGYIYHTSVAKPGSKADTSTNVSLNEIKAPTLKKVATISKRAAKKAEKSKKQAENKRWVFANKSTRDVFDEVATDGFTSSILLFNIFA